MTTENHHRIVYFLNIEKDFESARYIYEKIPTKLAKNVALLTEDINTTPEEVLKHLKILPESICIRILNIYYAYKENESSFF